MHVTHNAQRVRADSIMELLMLAASRGSTITIEGEGLQAALAVDALTQLVEQRFGEDT